jgi:hypothetical protein
VSDVGRLRFSIDIVGEHGMDDAIGLQGALIAAARAAVGSDVRLDLLPSHEHAVGCTWCKRSMEDPGCEAQPLTGP